VLQEGEFSAFLKKNSPHVTITICAFLSVFFLNSGMLSLIFLVPMGFAILAGCPFLLTLFVTAGFNIVFSLMTIASSGAQGSIFFELVYLTAMLGGFAWIMGGSAQIRTVYRFIIASAAAALLFLVLFVGSRRDSGFSMLLLAQAELLSSVFASTAGDDAARRAAMQQAISPDVIIDAFRAVSLRGGAVITFFFLFFISRQLSITALWLIKKQRNTRGLSAFFVPQNAIWVLSCSLVLLLLTRLLKIEIIEILAWNVFCVCGILFLAQGAGIALHILYRRTQIFRFVANILFIIVMFSPFVNIIALAALLLLGIAENFVAIRASTPGQKGDASP